MERGGDGGVLPRGRTVDVRLLAVDTPETGPAPPAPPGEPSPEQAPDVDCPDVSGPVDVEGSDPHRLDRDGDGTGRETA